ncbi:MAG TPA: glycine--tRNA ligase subunit beta, partial [Caulobacterales bacterium]|nr:glycine--tRNA ligase subunit beta [Caulobacterales bacterium]
MPQLLLELFSEEIPARMQKRAEEDLAKLVLEKLKAQGLKPAAVKTFSSPRHLGLVIEELEAKAADVSEERKGPRVGAPEQALAGFLKSAGLSSIEQAQIVNDKKGDFYVARIARTGRATPEILREIVREVIRAFPWPKSMRSQSGDLTWVRPLHNVLCVFDGAAVKIEIEGVGSEPVTWGHRFHAPKAIEVKSAAEHYAKLRDAKVLIDREERKGIILEQAKKVCAERKLKLVEDAGLLEEVTGLVEWPVVLMGRMDESFLDLPAEVIRLTMRTHQKYFAVRDPSHHGKLAPYFITVANIEAKDGGDAIAAGNARVLSARLNDARYFWDVDRFYDPIEKTKPKKLDAPERIEKLKQIVFHQKLGSVWDKVERVKALAVELCAVTKADPKLVERAATLMKCDLVTETVGEFPELQGQIGRELYLAELSTGPLLGGEGAAGSAADEGRTSQSAASAARPSPPTPSPPGGGGYSVAQAIEDHYRPLGPNDRVPTDPVAVTLALADKLDTLVGFWRIDEKPTGSSDAYGLRRAGLGIIRVIVDNALRASMMNLTGMARRQYGETALDVARLDDFQIDLVRFVNDRMRVALRDRGERHDLLDAVFRKDGGDLTLNLRRLAALDAFLKTEDGANLLAGYKRAANILEAESKKGRGLEAEPEQELDKGVQTGLLKEDAEKALATA